MKLNDYFDNIYIINLEHRTDRWQHCEEQMAKHGFTAEKFKALGATDMIKGWQACTLSHISVLEDAKQRGFQRVLVLEDDFVLHDDFNSIFSAKYSNAYQVLYLGIGHKQPPVEFEYSYYYKVVEGYTSHAVAYNDVQNIDEFLIMAKELTHVIDE